MLKLILLFLIVHTQAWAVELSSEQAVMMALRSNTVLAVQKINSKIIKTREQSSRSKFDAKINASIVSSHKKGLRGYSTGEETAKNIMSLSLSKQLKTGTVLTLSGSSSLENINEDPVNDIKKFKDIELELNQALLKGRGSNIALVEVRKASLNTQITVSQLKGYTMGLITDVLHAYWNTYYLKARLKMVEVSKQLAQAQKQRVLNMVEAGQLAEIEIAASKAELASREELVVSARGDFDIQRINLIALLKPGKEKKINWNTPFDKMEDTSKVDLNLAELKGYIQRGLKQRPEIHQVKDKLTLNELELIQSRNGLLPKLDLFMRVNRSKFHDSFINKKSDKMNKGQELTVGLNFSYALGHRAEKAQLKKSVYSRKQQELSLINLQLIIEVDIRLSWIQVHKLKQKEKAATQTLKFRRESLKAELNKFDVGRSTSLNVARVQRDLLSAELGHLKTKIDIIKALVSLAEAEGGLIDRYAVIAE